MARKVAISRRQEWLAPGWVEQEAGPPFGVAGAPTQTNAATQADFAKKVGVAGPQSSSLYGVGD
jgi:hypothetical protein